MGSQTGTVSIFSEANGQLDPILGVTDEDFTKAERRWGANAPFTLTDKSGTVHELDGADVKIMRFKPSR